jgi:hypothetical protein
MNNTENNTENTTDAEYSQINNVLTEYLGTITDNKHIISAVQGGLACFMLGRAMAVPPQFSIPAGLVFGIYKSIKKQSEQKKSEEEAGTPPQTPSL